MTLVSLKPEQRKFLEDNIKQSKCNLWIEKLAKLKGVTITDDMKEDDIHKKLDDWILVDVLDGGYMKRPYKCLCGKPLRFQYIVENKSKDITIALGRDCLSNYTGLDENLVNDVIREHHKVNTELDEILIRYNEGFIGNHIGYLKEPALPAKYKSQIEYGLPLSKRQELRTTQLIKDYYDDIQREKIQGEMKQVEERLSKEQKKFLNTVISKEEKHQLIIRLKDGQCIYTLADIEDLEVSDIVERKVVLGLPLSKEEEKDIKHQKLIQSSRFEPRNDATEIAFQKRKAKKKNIEYTLNYQTICNNHGELLKQISSKQEEIPEPLQEDWSNIKSMIECAELGNEVPRREFLLLLSNLASSVQIYTNVYDCYR